MLKCDANDAIVVFKYQLKKPSESSAQSFKSIEIKCFISKQKLFLGLVAHGANGWEHLALTPPGWDTNPMQVSSQQTLVLIYLPRKDGKAELALAGKKVAQIFKSRQSRGFNWGLGVGKQIFYHWTVPILPPSCTFIKTHNHGKNSI